MQNVQNVPDGVVVLLASGTLYAYSPECIKIVLNTSNAPDGVLVYSEWYALCAMCVFLRSAPYHLKDLFNNIITSIITIVPPKMPSIPSPIIGSVAKKFCIFMSIFPFLYLIKF